MHYQISLVKLLILVNSKEGPSKSHENPNADKDVENVVWKFDNEDGSWTHFMIIFQVLHNYGTTKTDSIQETDNSNIYSILIANTWHSDVLTKGNKKDDNSG